MATNSSDQFRSDDVRGALAAAWSQRMALRIEDSRRSVARIKAYAGSDRQAEYEVLLLEASFARAEADLERSRELLRLARARQLELGLEAHFHWDFQNANNLYAQGQFALALELFLRAKARARDAYETAVALGSALLCSEALGLPFAPILAELEPLVGRIQDPLRRESFDEQIFAFRMRESLRAGRAAEIWDARDLPGRSQGRWMQAWASALPYLEAPAWARDRRVDDFNPEMNAFGYRMRTLFGAGPASAAAKAQVKAERLYLWTWRWMTGEAKPAQIEETLESLDIEELRDLCALGDLQLVSLSLRWLAAFQPSWRAPVVRLLAALEPPQATWAPALAFERDLAGAFARLGPSRDRALAGLAKRAPQDATTRWPEAIARLRAFAAKTKPVTRGSPALEVDVATSRLRVRAGKGKALEEIVSEPLCRLFEALRETGSLRFDEALEICFGIAPYDPDVHRPKIHNLLARARRALPEGAHLASRGDVIYLSGDVGEIAFANGAAEMRQPAWLRNRASARTPGRHLDRWIRPQAVLKHAAQGKDLTRRQMESMIRCSKATAHRLLSEWERQGLVHRSGVGRGVRYRIELAPAAPVQ